MRKRVVEMKREAALQDRLDKLGASDPVCGICGETDVRTFELHHPAGQKQHRAFTSQICANDHRKMTFEQNFVPSMHPDADTFLYAAGRLLIGIADMLREMIEYLYDYGTRLIERSLPASKAGVA